MTINEYQRQTNINIKEKANLIWEIATKLYGEYKPHEYGRVILPMTVIKRFDDSLSNTKKDVLNMVKTLDDRKVEGTARDAILKSIAKKDFYNTSKFDFKSLLADPDNISANFTSYLQGYSDNVKDIISRFEFDKEISKMTENDLLYTIINEFNSKKANMAPEVMTSQDMGYIFEELIRKFSESYDEQAGAHFTSRDIIYLMTELLIAPERDSIKQNGCNKTAYDMAMGTSQMLACLDEKLKEINENSHLMCFGQEFNPETYAIAKSDMLIKGGNAENMKFGDTLSNDQFEDTTFDYIISNPPFGIDWKKEKEAVERESKLGFDGRFGPGLPSVSDGQLLFLLNGVKKLKNNGRMAIIQNASPLFNGDAGSGPSEIRRYLIENDYIEALIELPGDLFYNTPINTWIWIITKNKPQDRLGKIQLIDASNCFVRRRKSIGDKKVDIDDKCIELILEAYKNNIEKNYSYYEKNYYKTYDLKVKSKIFLNDFFKYTKVTIQFPKEKNGNITKNSKAKVKTDPKKKFEINIPSNEDISLYINTKIMPDFKDAIYEPTENVIGYEIPFIRIFHELEEIRSSIEVCKDIEKLDNDKTEIEYDLANLENREDIINTDIKYLSEIPSNWQITRVRNLFYISKEKANEKEPTVLTLARSGIKIRDISTNEGQLAESYESYNPVEINDLLLNPMDLISGDNCSISKVKGVISPAYINLRAYDKLLTNSDYYNYYFKTQYWIKSMFEQGKGVSFDNRWTMNSNACLNLAVPKLSYEEQTAIVNKIETKVNSIDDIIKQEERKIELLKELKKSIIYEYVTGKRKVED